MKVPSGEKSQSRILKDRREEGRRLRKEGKEG
jgi:hypothetical protein